MATKKETWRNSGHRTAKLSYFAFAWAINLQAATLAGVWHRDGAATPAQGFPPFLLGLLPGSLLPPLLRWK